MHYFQTGKRKTKKPICVSGALKMHSKDNELEMRNLSLGEPLRSTNCITPHPSSWNRPYVPDASPQHSLATQMVSPAMLPILPAPRAQGSAALHTPSQSHRWLTPLLRGHLLRPPMWAACPTQPSDGSSQHVPA